MDFRLTSEQNAFRREFVSWLENNYPAGFDPTRFRNYDAHEDMALAHREFQKRLSDAGYAGMHVPEAYGGRGRTTMEEMIVLETISRMCPELRAPGVITFGMAAPTILVCGNEDQKKEFLPKILDGRHIWCQGFSEPNAGSDVVNVSTRAVRENGHYVVNGQKVWTSFAHLADYCILLVRTDPGTKKHKGLSYLLMDMTLSGVEVRPIRQITGEADFNEVYMEDVRVPENMLLGKEGDGWKIALTTLAFERAMGDVSKAAMYETNVERMIDMAGQVRRSGRPAGEDPVFRQDLARSYIEVMALKYHGLRNFSNQLEGGTPGPEGSIGKLLWSEPFQRISEAAADMQGPMGQIGRPSPWSVHDGFWQFWYLRSKGSTIECRHVRSAAEHYRGAGIGAAQGLEPGGQRERVGRGRGALRGCAAARGRTPARINRLPSPAF